jgi:hypothetical protein
VTYHANPRTCGYIVNLLGTSVKSAEVGFGAGGESRTPVCCLQAIQEFRVPAESSDTVHVGGRGGHGDAAECMSGAKDGRDSTWNPSPGVSTLGSVGSGELQGRGDASISAGPLRHPVRHLVVHRDVTIRRTLLFVELNSTYRVPGIRREHREACHLPSGLPGSPSTVPPRRCLLACRTLAHHDKSCVGHDRGRASSQIDVLDVAFRRR